MKCLVCGHDFDRDDFCPRCRFPVTLYTDESEASLREEQARADRYRKKMVDMMTVSVNGYSYSLSSEKVDLTLKQTILLGSARELQEKPVWLSQKLTNLSSGSMDVEVVCTLFEQSRQIRTKLKADSQEPELSFGVRVDGNLQLHLMLKDEKQQLDDQLVDLLEKN